MQQAVRFGQRRLISRVVRTVPWLGTAVALLAVGATIRRKGLLGGTLDSALNAIPFVGALKGFAETARGREFIRERARDHVVGEDVRVTGTPSSRGPAVARH